MPYSFTEFFLTDGTTFIDLLRNFRLAQFQPGTLTYKDGGTFQSGLGDGRRLVQRYYDNITDQLTLIVKTGCQSSAIADLRRLRQMLEKAADYWASGWSDEPVYLISRSIGDNQERFAVLVAGIAPGDPDPFAQPFAGPLDVFGPVNVSFEHTPWQNNAPGTGTALPISVYQYTTVRPPGAGDFIVWGNADAADSWARDEVTDGTAFVSCYDANYHDFDAGTGDNISTYSNIDYVIGGDSGGAGTGNVNDPDTVVYPVALSDDVSAGPFVNTGIYFGSANRFCNIVVDIETANGNLTFGDWQYWDGAAWATLTVNDGTNDFANTGVRTVTFSIPTDWATTTAFGVINTYWVRLHITNSGGPATVPPTQQNRLIYAATSPYVEIQAANLGGDIPVLLSIQAASKRYPAAGASGQLYNNLLIASRSMSRGEEFSPYVGMVDNDGSGSGYAQPYDLSVSTPANVTFDAYGGPYSTRLKFDEATDLAATEYVNILFGSAARSAAWTGSFRVFVRTSISGGAVGDFELAMQLVATSDSSIVYTTDYKAINATDIWAVTDLGIVTRDPTYDTEFRLIMNKPNAGAEILYVYDVIFMPVDEWLGAVSFPVVTPGKTFTPSVSSVSVFLADPILYPVKGTYSAVDMKNQLPTLEPINAQYSSAGPPVLQKASKQRLFFFGYTSTAGSDVVSARPWETFGITLESLNRYQHLKGSAA